MLHMFREFNKDKSLLNINENNMQKVYMYVVVHIINAIKVFDAMLQQI